MKHIYKKHAFHNGIIWTTAFIMYKQGFLITVHLVNYPVVAEPADIHCSLNSTLPCIVQWFFRQHHSEFPGCFKYHEHMRCQKQLPWLLCALYNMYWEVAIGPFWGRKKYQMVRQHHSLKPISHWPKESTFMKSEARKFTDSFKNKTEGTYQECRCFCW